MKEAQLLLRLGATQASPPDDPSLKVVCERIVESLRSLGFDRVELEPLTQGQQAALATVLPDSDAGSSRRGKAINDAMLSANSLEKLQAITLALTSVRGREQLLTMIIEQAVSLLHAASGGIYAYRPELGELHLIADFRSPEYVGRTLEVGQGITGRLILTGQSYMVVNNYHQWEGRSPGLEPIRGAVLEVPLQWEGRVIGVLYVDDDVGRLFSASDIRLLRLFADHAAIALINTTLLQNDEQKLRRLERLARATHEIIERLEAISLRERLALIAHHAADILEAEATGVFLARGHELVLEASFGQREGFTPGRVPALKIHNQQGGGLTGFIAHRGELFSGHGKPLEEHPAVAHSQSHSLSGKCYSLLAIPLKRRIGNEETLLGLLRADNKKGEDGRPLPTLAFTEEDASILRIFAEAAVVAIESAELVDRLQEQRDFQQRLISSSPDGIIAVDRHGRITEFNKRAEEILGYSREEVLGKPVSGIYSDPREPSRIGALLHAGSDYLRNYETLVLDKGGSMIPIRHSSSWLYSAEGERIGSVGYFEDLRSQKASERRARKSAYLEALYIASKAITAQFGLQKHQLLDEIIQPALMGIMGVHGSTPILGTIHSYDEERDELLLESVYPPTRYEDLKSRLGQNRAFRAPQPAAGRIGVTGRAIVTGLPQLVRDVRSDRDYIECDTSIISEIAAPLIYRGKVIGVLNAESNRAAAFEEEDLEALQTLAELAVVALQNVHQAEQLREALEVQKALAWMGLGNSTSLHEGRGDLGVIRNELYLLRKELDKEGRAIHSPLTVHLANMAEAAEQLAARLKVPFDDNQDRDSQSLVHVNRDLILSRTNPLKSKRLEDVPLQTLCELGDEVTVHANAYWLRRAIDILLRNAVDSTEGQVQREIILGSRSAGKMAEIIVADNGRGVPAEIASKLFRTTIRHAGSRGWGLGLVIATTLVQAYGGEIRWEQRTPRGTTMVISLPIAGGLQDTRLAGLQQDRIKSLW